MMNRIADAAQNTRMTGYLQLTQSRMRDTQVAVATGKAAQSYAEISDQAALLVSSRHQQRVLDTHATLNETAIDRLTTMGGALGNIEDVIDRVRSLTVQRLSGPSGEDVPLDIEIDTMLEEIAGQINIKLDNRYLFSGSKTDTQPIDLPATIANAASLANVYQGDAIALSVRADEHVSVAVPVSGADLTGILETLADLKEAHQAGDLPTLQAALDLLDVHLDELSALQGLLGAKSTQLGSIRDDQLGSLDYLNQIVSRIEDTDLPTALTQLAQDEALLEATYLTITTLNKLSLADYLR